MCFVQYNWVLCIHSHNTKATDKLLHFALSIKNMYLYYLLVSTNTSNIYKGYKSYLRLNVWLIIVVKKAYIHIREITHKIAEKLILLARNLHAFTESSKELSALFKDFSDNIKIFARSIHALAESNQLDAEIFRERKSSN